MADNPIGLRSADAHDAEAIAQLHADSWRHHYRGAYSARYLDGDLDGERFSVWTGRLGQDRDDEFTVVAETTNRVIGFVHLVLDADPTWGAVVENLHVTRSLHRTGVGTTLLAAAARIVIDRRPTSALYLWVQEQNTNAQAFYVARRGQLGDREPIPPPGGHIRNLDGHPFKLRASWLDPSILLPPS